MSLALTTISLRTKLFVFKKVIARACEKKRKKHSSLRHTAFDLFDLFDLFKSLSKQESKHGDFRRRNVSWFGFAKDKKITLFS